MTDNLTPCGRCGHARWNHEWKPYDRCRFETGPASISFVGDSCVTVIAESCPCPEFVEPKGERDE